MHELLILLQIVVVALALDLDNALFMMNAVTKIPSSQRWLFMFVAHALEFTIRLLALFIFSRILRAEQVLFTVFGLDVTVITIALIVAGLFLSIRNGSAFFSLLFENEEEDVPEITMAGFWRQSFQAGGMLLLMSIDTLLTLMSSLDSAVGIIAILFISGSLRLLFVRPLASIILRYQLVTMTVTAFLMLIGITLITDAFGIDIDQRNFNFVLIVIVLSGILYSRVRNQQPSQIGNDTG